MCPAGRLIGPFVSKCHNSLLKFNSEIRSLFNLTFGRSIFPSFQKIVYKFKKKNRQEKFTINRLREIYFACPHVLPFDKREVQLQNINRIAVHFLASAVFFLGRELGPFRSLLGPETRTYLKSSFGSFFSQSDKSEKRNEKEKKTD